MLIRYKNIIGLLEGMTGNLFFLFEKCKERYLNHLFLNRFNLYKVKRKLVTNSYIKSQKPNKIEGVDFTLVKLLILFKDKKLIKLF